MVNCDSTGSCTMPHSSIDVCFAFYVFALGQQRFQLARANCKTSSGCRSSIRVFPKIRVPQNGWFIMENLGVPLYLETPIPLLHLFHHISFVSLSIASNRSCIHSEILSSCSRPFPLAIGHNTAKAPVCIPFKIHA